MEELKKKMVPVLKKHGVIRAGLFGSVVREDFSSKSDVDVLVQVPKGLSYFDVIGIQIDLEETIGRKVDVVEYQNLRERIKQRVLDQEVRLYE